MPRGQRRQERARGREQQMEHVMWWRSPVPSDDAIHTSETPSDDAPAPLVNLLAQRRKKQGTRLLSSTTSVSYVPQSVHTTSRATYWTLTSRDDARSLLSYRTVLVLVRTDRRTNFVRGREIKLTTHTGTHRPEVDTHVQAPRA